MIQRCGNPRHRSYPHYGGVGIRVCDRWRLSFQAFVQDVGLPPDSSYVLKRIDFSKDYQPDNVAWGTRLSCQQSVVHAWKITFHGRTQSLSAWAREIGMLPESLRNRLRRMDVVTALTRPKGSAPREPPRKSVHASSKYRGVSWNQKAQKWEVRLRRDGKVKYFGLFPTEKEAALAYEAALAAKG